jgi:uncharacterized protein YebE (UPF0316 family)
VSIFVVFLVFIPFIAFPQTEGNNNEVINNKYITLYPLQIFTTGEYRINYENLSCKKLNLYGIGLIYSNKVLLNNFIASDRYYGINIFIGKKKSLKKIII